MSTIRRAPTESFPETVSWLAELFSVDRRTATHIAWNVCFRIGTDRHLWVDETRAHRFIERKS